ncbi:nucleotidyltransferase domain-containing protein [Bacillus cereus]|uniref:nucleotidyltransferase domain-containing protein n=1 Tax=Bacillus cereus TaxID=1396 RepID=UPI003D98B73A
MNNILNQIVTCLSASAGVVKVILFGSRAIGNNSPRSDYDIAFETIDLTDQEVNVLIANTLDYVETLHNIDIIHINSITNSQLRHNIQTQGKLLYQK